MYCITSRPLPARPRVSPPRAPFKPQNARCANQRQQVRHLRTNLNRKVISCITVDDQIRCLRAVQSATSSSVAEMNSVVKLIVGRYAPIEMCCASGDPSNILVLIECFDFSNVVLRKLVISRRPMNSQFCCYIIYETNTVRHPDLKAFTRPTVTQIKRPCKLILADYDGQCINVP